MNIHPSVPPTIDAPLAPADWTMEVIEDEAHCAAVIKRKERTMCRVSLATTPSRPGRCRAALARSARMWIKDYLQRPGVA